MTGVIGLRSATQNRFLRDTIKLPQLHVVIRTVISESISQPELLMVETKFQAPCHRGWRMCCMASTKCGQRMCLANLHN